MHKALSYLNLFYIFFLCLLISSCSAFRQYQQLDYKKINPANTQKIIDYGVYTPPNWQISERLPLIVFLHGAGGNHESFERFGANKYFDKQINMGNMPRVILISPNGDLGFWENWADGSHNYRDWVTKDILPLVQNNYNTLDCPENCHVMGLSMGGFGALRFSYVTENIFSSVSAFSAPIISDEEKEKTNNSFLIQLIFPFDKIYGVKFSKNYVENTIEKEFINNKNSNNVRLQLFIGDNDLDQMIKNNQRFHEKLVSNNIDHEYIIYQGEHKWKDWIPNFTRSINFLVDDKYKVQNPKKLIKNQQ